MPSLTISIPPDSLRVNARSGRSWTVASADKADYQETVRKEALVQGSAWKGWAPPNGWPVHVHVVAYLGMAESGKRMQRADPWDMLTWLKSAVDALVSMGVFPDDSEAYTNPVTVTVAKDRQRPRCELHWE